MNRREFIGSIAFSSLATGAISSLPAISSPGNKILVNADNQIQRFGDGRDWFFEKRFGMFIHWGLYSIPGWHEQHQYRAKVDRDEYAKLKERWNPYKFNPEKWLDTMEEAGMKYLCITAKHCDGFCLWDTNQTSYNTTNTPFKRDIIGMISDACHKRNIPLCLYYSVVDWHNPNYPNQGRAHELPPQPQDNPNKEAYMEFLISQVKELCSNYGDIYGFWWDANRLGIEDRFINQMVRNLQPKAVINNRGFDEGDFSTPERDYEKDDHISFNRPTEACQSVGIESWGYRKNEDYYTDRYLIRSIDKYLSRDANYLLNVGPDSKGIIPKQSKQILKNIGKWYGAVKESLEEVEPASKLTSNKNVMLTKRKNVLYVHLNRDPEGNVVKLRPFTVAPQSATLLNNNKRIEFELEFAPQDFLKQKSYLRLINLPTNKLCNTVLVIKLEFDGLPEEYVQDIS